MTTRKAWNENIETRVASTSNVLAQIKEAKMLGLTAILADRVQQQFETEVVLLMKNRQYYAVTLGICKRIC